MDFIHLIIDALPDSKLDLDDLICTESASMIPSLTLSLIQWHRVLSYHNYNRDTTNRFIHDILTVDNNMIIPIIPSTILLGSFHSKNNCYLDSMVFALFARVNAYDHILTSNTNNIVRKMILFIVNQLRNGSRVAGLWYDLARFYMVQKHILPLKDQYEQQDVAEIFEKIMDDLSAPVLPFLHSMHHQGPKEDSDSSVIGERAIHLSCPDDGFDLSMEYLLDEYFFNNTIYGLERQGKVDAWKTLKFIPNYYGNDQGTIAAQLIVPIVLKRYQVTDRGIVKLSRRISIPCLFDFTRFISGPGESNRYLLHLQSVVCHVGSESTMSGHYISVVCRDKDSKPFQSWLVHDDMASSAVTKIDKPPGLFKLFSETIDTCGYLFLYELIDLNGLGEQERRYWSDNLKSHGDYLLALQLESKESCNEEVHVRTRSHSNCRQQ